MPEFRCPICGKTVFFGESRPACYPFCSPRCQWIDLGRWLREDYSIDRDRDPDELLPDVSPPQNQNP